MSEKLYSIQALRAVAAIMVVAHHSVALLDPSRGPSLFAGFSYLGAAGVDIFFVISGFLMVATTQHRQPGTDAARSFMRARLARIVPLYWSFTALLVIGMLLFPAGFSRSTFDPAWVVSSFLFLPYPNPNTGTVAPIVFTGWTLNYEMWFYVLFGAALLLPKRARLPAVVASLGALAALSLAGFQGATMRELTNPVLLEFGLGVALGWAYTRGVVASRGLALVLIAASVVLFCAGLPLVQPLNPDRLWLWGIPAAMLVAGMVSMQRAGWWQRQGMLTGIGDWSYSLYLSHALLLPVFFKVAARLDPARRIPGEVFTLAALPVALAGGYLTYLLLERPMGRLLRSRAARAPIAPAVVAQAAPR